MGVYEDMANDAGYAFGTDENRQMAEAIAYNEQREWQEYEEHQWLNDVCCYYWAWWFNLGNINAG